MNLLMLRQTKEELIQNLIGIFTEIMPPTGREQQASGSQMLGFTPPGGISSRRVNNGSLLNAYISSGEERGMDPLKLSTKQDPDQDVNVDPTDLFSSAPDPSSNTDLPAEQQAPSPVPQPQRAKPSSRVPQSVAANSAPSKERRRVCLGSIITSKVHMSEPQRKTCHACRKISSFKVPAGRTRLLKQHRQRRGVTYFVTSSNQRKAESAGTKRKKKVRGYLMEVNAGTQCYQVVVFLNSGTAEAVDSPNEHLMPNNMFSSISVSFMPHEHRFFINDHVFA